MSSKSYAGIGRRNAPKEILLLMQLLAFELAARGFALRSGGAEEGSDRAFLRGALEFLKTSMHPNYSLVRIYTPSLSHRSYLNPEYKQLIERQCFKSLDQLFLQDKAKELAGSVHPNWAACKGKFAELAHGRNAHILLGDDLTDPVERVICWCEESPDGTVTGGTATAINLARRFNIPIINLWHDSAVDKVLALLNISRTRWLALSGVSQ